VVIVHGYSDHAQSCGEWCRQLRQAGYAASDIHVTDYITLSNEITIKDIAEGFDRAIRLQPGLRNGEPFDAIVHSTGMLVLRSWLLTYEARRDRLKHLIGLAPATFGSPLAHQGRSMLGAIFKGSKAIGPDFLEQGDRVLSALELGSRYTWDLAHQDFLGESVVYGGDDSTPYPFIFVGLDDYGGLESFVTESNGTDGTIRWAGAGFNCRKIVVDLTIDPSTAGRPRVTFQPWKNTNVPLVLIPNHNHTTILREPRAELVAAVVEALAVAGEDAYSAWRDTYRAQTEAHTATTPKWQQFITHLVDERGDGIADYFVELYTTEGGAFTQLAGFKMNVHPYAGDPSYRCFHVNLDSMKLTSLSNLWLRLIASSGTKLVAYHGYGSERMTPAGRPLADGGKWDAVIDLSENLGGPIGTEHSFFQPYTTSLIEMKMNREPMPLEIGRVSSILTFVERVDGRDE
jgi:hypothetical protein